MHIVASGTTPLLAGRRPAIEVIYRDDLPGNVQVAAGRIVGAFRAEPWASRSPSSLPRVQ